MVRKSRLAIGVVGVVAVVGAVAGTLATFGPGSAPAPSKAASPEYCGTMRALLEPPAGTPNQATYERVDQLVARLAEQAHEPMREQVRIYSVGVHKFVAEVAKVGFDVGKVTPEQYSALQTPEMTKAAEAVMTSAKTDCSIDPAAGSSTAQTSVPPAPASGVTESSAQTPQPSAGEPSS